MRRVLSLAALVVALAGCGGSGDAEQTVIDVRTPAEYAESHVAGAQNIDVLASDFRSRIERLDEDGSYVVYCRSGNRAGAAAEQMRSLGLEVENGGGLEEMRDAGFEFDSG